MSMHFANVLPLWLTILLAGGLLLAIVHGTATLLRKHVKGRLVAVLSALRFAILTVFVLALFQPALSFTREVKQLPEMAILVDVSKSMGQASQTGRLSRLEEMQQVLQKGELAQALRHRFALSWFAFDGTASPISDDDAVRLHATGETTLLAASIGAASTHLRALGKNPQRILLVSDGQDQGNVDPAELARKLGMAIDVLAPTASPASQPGEVEIIDVQSARRVLLGSETHFRLTVGGRLPAHVDRSYTLAGTENGKKVLEQSLTLKAGQAEQTLSLAHRPTAAGILKYEFSITPAAAEKAKPHALNVQVLDSKYEVLILEDTWRWEYKFLHRLFEDDPSFRFTALLPRGGKAFVQFGSPDRRVNLVGFPQSRADLEAFDTFVLGDVNPARWSRGLATALAQLITEEGKSLVVIAGPNLPNLAEFPELHALLPVELARESGTPIEGVIDVRLRADAGTSPFFFHVPVGDGDKLPALDHVYPAVRKRPGATVLLEAAKHRNPYGNLIVMAEQSVGRGRVLYLGTDTLWKWQTLSAIKEGPTPYNLFWQQAFRALTPARSNIGPVNLWLNVSRARSEVGRPIVVQAEIQSERPMPTANLQAFVTLPDEKRLPLLFTADVGNTRLFRAEFVSNQSGGLQISASVIAQGKPVAEGSAVIQVDEPKMELDDRGVDLANLSRLATATGGQVIDAGRPETWPATSESSLPIIRKSRTLDLWNNFTLLLLLCTLLAADWFLRLFKGLV